MRSPEGEKWREEEEKWRKTKSLKERNGRDMNGVKTEREKGSKER